MRFLFILVPSMELIIDHPFTDNDAIDNVEFLTPNMANSVAGKTNILFLGRSIWE